MIPMQSSSSRQGVTSSIRPVPDPWYGRTYSRSVGQIHLQPSKHLRVLRYPGWHRPSAKRSRPAYNPLSDTELDDALTRAGGASDEAGSRAPPTAPTRQKGGCRSSS